jgi:hypothetical protein
MSVKRTIIIEPGVDPDTGEVYLRLPEALARLERLMGTLAEVGGQLRVVADRVKTGELPGSPRADVLGETVGFVIEYDSQAPLHKRSLTQHMMDMAALDDDAPRAAAPAEEPLEEPGEAAPAGGSLAAAVGAMVAAAGGVETPEPRFMSGPGGEEEEVPAESWAARLRAGWTFDDQDQDEVEES